MRIICLMGPTAIGKSQLAIDLARRFPLDIISVDSAMVYRGLDVGTAKPNPDILQEIPHRLIDICDPKDAYSVAEFAVDALQEIKKSIENHRVPLLVGGTMMYFNVLQKGISDMPSANAELRAELTAEGEQYGWPYLHERLSRLDPTAAARIHPHDRQRTQRALEVYLLTGKTLTEWQETSSERIFTNQIVNVIMEPSDRAELHQRIAERFTEMLANGFMEEVRALYNRPDLNLNLPALRAVGYRQAWEHLAGKCSLQEMKEKAIIATCQLAKRQLTWLRQWGEATRFLVDGKEGFLKVEKWFERWFNGAK